jgi:hypothetical protein
MNSNGFMPWSEVLLEDVLRYQRAACFALGCLEREHRLNVEALMAYWTGASLAWWTPMPRRAPTLPPPGTVPRASRNLLTRDAEQYHAATDPPEAP